MSAKRWSDVHDHEVGKVNSHRIIYHRKAKGKPLMMCADKPLVQLLSAVFLYCQSVSFTEQTCPLNWNDLSATYILNANANNSKSFWPKRTAAHQPVSFTMILAHKAQLATKQPAFSTLGTAVGGDRAHLSFISPLLAFGFILPVARLLCILQQGMLAFRIQRSQLFCLLTDN